MKKIADGLWHLIEVISRFCLKILFTLLHKDLTEDIVEGFLQFVRFGLVGVSNTIVSYGLYVICLLILQKNGLFPKSDYLVSQIVSFVIGVLWAFYWNDKYVFTLKQGEQRSLWKSLIKTYISYSFTGLFLNSILLVLWIQICHIPDIIAPLFNLIVSVPINFVVNKLWAFKKTA